MGKNLKVGQNTVIAENAKIGKDVYIGHNCIVENGVTIEDGVYIDSNTIIRTGTELGSNSFVGANCIVGEYQMDFILDRQSNGHDLVIGNNAIIRSGTIIYTGSRIGNNFQTGHQVNIRENSDIGDYVSLGTLSDVQGDCKIGNYVRAHSNCHIAQHATIESFVWLFPYVVFTNDPTPPSEDLAGVYVHSFAVIASRSVILPGKEIGQDALVGAGSVVTRDVAPYAIVSGNPAKKIADVKQLNKVAGKEVYPWRENFTRGMPWADVGFDEWYYALSSEEKEHFNITDLKES